MGREFCWKTVTRRRGRNSSAEKKIRMNLRYIVRKLDGNGQGWCVMLDFDISCVEPFGSALRLFSSSAVYPATF